MEKYCVKNGYEEMDKSWSQEDYLKIAERQHERLSQKDEEYIEMLCFILEQQENEYDLAIIRGESYDKFYSSDEEEDMEMKIVEAKDFYDEFKKISNIDLFEEKCFVRMAYIDEGRNDVNLIAKDNGVNKRYIIGIVG